jgi:hypothetical protein
MRPSCSTTGGNARSPHRATLALALGVAVVGGGLALMAAPAAYAQSDGSTSDLSRVLLLAGDDGLRAQGMDYTVQQIDFLGREGGHSTVRWVQKEFRWVRGDSRRGTQGIGLTVLVDHGWAESAPGGVDPATLDAAATQAARTWRLDSCLASNPLRSVVHPGGDVTVFDFLLGTGPFGDPFAADVVVAGPAPGMEGILTDDILAFAVTFVFVGPDGEPTDVDRDGYLDTALSEVYLNPTVDWTLPAGAGGTDLETVLLHELGHALGLGHFGSPPESVMTPVYAGVRRALFPIDHAALCLINGRHRP